MTSTREILLEKTDALTEKAADLANEASKLAADVASFAGDAAVQAAASGGHGSTFINSLTVFILACFVGYYVVWRVTPALHSPLMGVTNAISSVIIVGGIIAAGPLDGDGFSKMMGFFAIMLASVNIFGGFIVTQRMLEMFKKKK